MGREKLTTEDAEDAAKVSGQVGVVDLSLEELFKDFVRGRRVTS